MTSKTVETFAVPPFPMDRDVLGKGVGMKVLPDDAVPSEHSIMAAMMRARGKCAPSRPTFCAIYLRPPNNRLSVSVVSVV